MFKPLALVWDPGGRFLLQLQTIKAIVNSRRFKGSSSDEPRRVQVLDLLLGLRVRVQEEEMSIKD